MLERALRGARHRHGVAARLELADPLPDEVGLHRLAVELLHPAGGLLGREPGDLLEHRLGVGVAGPEPLEVEHAEAAEAAQLGGGGRGHDAVGRATP